jgi:hypothetical protein
VTLEEVGRFTDQQLIARLRGLVRADQALGGRLLVHLGEVDAPGLYREQAYSSMFAYCVEELHMSEAETYLRIQAARLGREFPLVVQLFEQGALHLSAIKRIGPHLTADNHVQVLERARGKGKREIELLVAELAPKPDVPSRMRKLPEMRRAPASQARAHVASPLDAHPALSILHSSIAAPRVLGSQASHSPSRMRCFGSGAHPAPFHLDASTAAPPVSGSEARQAALEGSIAAPRGGASDASFALEAPRPRASCVPLSPGRYKVEFTAGQGLHDRLEQLQALLRHRVPNGDLGLILELAVELLFDKTMKQRFAQIQTPKKHRSMQRDDAQTQAPKKQRSVPRDDAQTQTPEQYRAIQRGDERASGAARVQPPAARATSSPGARPRRVNSRYIPRAVVREVYARDAGRCTFVNAEGKRCSERGFLELHHHDVPYGKGGTATVDNLRLACRAHNALFAERDYGSRFMRFKQLQKACESRRARTHEPNRSFQERAPFLIAASVCACPETTTSTQPRNGA